MKKNLLLLTLLTLCTLTQTAKKETEQQPFGINQWSKTLASINFYLLNDYSCLKFRHMHFSDKNTYYAIDNTKHETLTAMNSLKMDSTMPIASIENNFIDGKYISFTFNPNLDCRIRRLPTEYCKNIPGMMALHLKCVEKSLENNNDQKFPTYKNFKEEQNITKGEIKPQQDEYNFIINVCSKDQDFFKGTIHYTQPPTPNTQPIGICWLNFNTEGIYQGIRADYVDDFYFPFSN